MQERAEILVERSADDVWRYIGDFGDVGWYLDIESFTRVADIREARIRGLDMTIRERLLHHDDANRSYTFCVADVLGETQIAQPDGSVFDLKAMFQSLHSTLTVAPSGDAASVVTYEIDMDTDAHMVATLWDRFQAVLDDLKRQLET